jgi:hypothetical protein
MIALLILRELSVNVMKQWQGAILLIKAWQ